MQLQTHAQIQIPVRAWDSYEEEHRRPLVIMELTMIYATQKLLTFLFVVSMLNNNAWQDLAWHKYIVCQRCFKILFDC